MALEKQNLHLYQTLEKAVLLQKNGFYRQKTHNSDKCTGQMSGCKVSLLPLISQASLFCLKTRFFSPAITMAGLLLTQ